MSVGLQNTSDCLTVPCIQYLPKIGSMHLKKTTGIMALSASLLLSPFQAVADTEYGPYLEGFEYPYPLQRFDFSSQQQTLSMGYMDVQPAGDANGRTVLLLHGKNF